MVYVLYISLVYVDFRFSLALLFFEGIQYGNLDVVIRSELKICFVFHRRNVENKYSRYKLFF